MNTQVQEGVTLDDESFRAIAELAYRESGLILVVEKSSMIQSRLRHRLRALGLNSFPAYCKLVQSDDGEAEKRHLISALTTNVSHFFRENHHFESLSDEVRKRLPTLRQGGELRIWSAGCSNGQEATSIAITLLELEPEIDKLNLRILATDIDPEVVAFARKAVYPERFMGGVPQPFVDKYFDRISNTDNEPAFQVKQKLRQMIRVNELNLLGEWPMRKRFDLIFCRNVVIYFDQKTQNALWPRYHEALKPDGTLYLGHSERIADPGAFGFSCTGPTQYQRRIT